MNKYYIKEVSRDLRAFGSIPFYFIVGIRSFIGEYMIFVWQLIIAAVALLAILFLTRKTKMQADIHIAAALVLCIFTSLFYVELLFTIFAFVLLALMIAASYYLKIKKMVIARGILAGVICSAISYLIAPLI
jgi:hypothetical protein